MNDARALAEFARSIDGEVATEPLCIEGGFVYPMECPGPGTGLQPQFLERAGLTVRVSETD